MSEYRIGFDDIIRASKHLISGSFQKFTPGETYISPHGSVLDGDDISNIVECALGGWITEGKYSKEFQRLLREFFGGRVRGVTLCNSGSSANLLAVSSLTAKEFGSRRIAPGDEVITTALGFPTTVNAILQNNAVPVFVDVDLHTYVPDPLDIEKAIIEGKTKAVILAHPLGMVFDAQKIREICDEYNIWLIEDICDAVGSTLNDRLVGTWGDMATISFYPAHHITMGEGGAILTQSPMVKKVVESFRDWGRDCHCLPGKDNTCGIRFEHEWKNLPFGFDHKYVYTHLGYNLKLTDLQAALGVSQVKKLPYFIEKRKQNYNLLYNGLQELNTYIRLPKVIDGAEPSWFGFPLYVKDFCCPFTAREMIHYLNEHKVGTRTFFAGNLIRHPAYEDTEYLIFDKLDNTDLIMKNSLFIGLHPFIEKEHIEYMVETIKNFVQEKIK